MDYRTLIEHDSTSVQCIFNWNTSVIGHKQWTVVFTQRKPIPRSNANSTVSNSNSGALSVLLFHVNSFTLINCPIFSTKKKVSSGYIRSELLVEARCDQTLRSQTRTKMLYSYACTMNRVIAHLLYSTKCYHTTQINI